MFKTVRRLISAAGFAVLTGILIGLAVLFPQFWFSFYSTLSAGLLRALASVTAVLPFSLWEILLALIVAGMLVYLIACLRRRRFLCWLAGLLELVVFLVFVFVAFWGLNHFGPSLDTRLGMQVSTYSESELKAATTYYLEQANSCSKQVSRDENGDVVFSDFSVLSDEARDGYTAIAAQYPLLAKPAAAVKPLISSAAFNYMGITGIYIAFTGEACVSTGTYTVDLPYTMCHELAHGMTVASEDGANYCAFLACENHTDAQFRYSGYYSAFIYCYNALYAVNKDAATALWSRASAEVIHDCNSAVGYYEQYEGKVQEATEKVNDTYLKAFSEEEGTQSYGAVADYLIEHYLNK